MSSADKFIDLLVQSHETSAKFIVNNQVDILLDMQLYTLGNRAEIVASRPAPVIVNYLVYPGTSGSEAHDYIVVDRIVAPPEHSQHYAERLLLLPPSYQVSIYDHLEGMPDFQKEDGSRDNARDDQILKICNFNKIDKLDPLSFRMWMQILRRVPRSRLYLLEPITSEEQKSIPPNSGPPPNVMAKRNLIDELQAEGFVYSEGNESTPSSRMEFYPRVSKVDHVRRYYLALNTSHVLHLLIFICLWT
jgi:predicted O-linked N-acetylglucosamine transferase (SPINDLY family)